MKKSIFILSISLLFSILFFRFTKPESTDYKEDVNKTAKFKIPDDIQPIIQKSCFGCHNTASKNDKAKAKLTFDGIEKLPKSKLVGTLGEITEVVKKGDMPPPPFLEKFPNAKPTDAERQKLVSWSEESAKSMTKHKSK